MELFDRGLHGTAKASELQAVRRAESWQVRVKPLGMTDRVMLQKLAGGCCCAAAGISPSTLGSRKQTRTDRCSEHTQHAPLSSTSRCCVQLANHAEAMVVVYEGARASLQM